MKKFAFASLALGMIVAAPAHALEHEITIDSAAGKIAADYDGVVQIDTKTVGTAKIPGRRNTQRCQYAVSLEVERLASMGEAFQARRSMISEDVLAGSFPGRCETSDARISSIIEAHRDRLQVALMELVEQDKQILVAEASTESQVRGG